MTALSKSFSSLVPLLSKSNPKRPAPHKDVNSKLFFTLYIVSSPFIAVCFVSYSNEHPPEQCEQVAGTLFSSQAFALYLKSELTNAPTGQTAIHSPQKVQSSVWEFLGIIVELYPPNLTSIASSPITSLHTLTHFSHMIHKDGS